MKWAMPTQCQRCGGPRIVRILARCSDLCGVGGRHSHGYVPSDLGIGGRDAVHFDCCLDCGQTQG
jgi:hypothetical protein